MTSIGSNGSTGAGDYAYWRYHIEGQDLQDLSKGTSAAKAFTLSFYFKSDITGTFAISIQDANSRMCNANYTVSNTNWNRYTITIPADTTGTIANSNASGLEINFWLVAGSNYTSGSAVHTWGAYSASSLATGFNAHVTTNGVNFYLTGVQLEVGSVATEFEHRSLGQELALCQRYYYRWTAGIANRYLWQGQSYSTTSCFGVIKEFPVTMRVAPTSTVSGTFTPFGDDGSTSGHSAFTTRPVDQNTKHSLATGGWDNGSGVGGGGRCVVVKASAATDYIDASAEL